MAIMSSPSPSAARTTSSHPRIVLVIALTSLAVACCTLLATASLAAPQPGERGEQSAETFQTTFTSVDAVLAAQWDFPAQSPAPLVVIIPGGGAIDRNGWRSGLGEDPDDGIYAQLTRELVKRGFAVFRYDKPGAGRSGRGRYATERSNAIEAYTRAVDHGRVDPDRVYLLGHTIGTDTLAGIYPRFTAVTPPAGAVLLDSMVGETASLRIDAPVLIVNASDPDDKTLYGSFVVEARARDKEHALETELVIIEGRDGILTRVERGDEVSISLDPRARDAVLRWLMEHRAPLGRSAALNR
jgi:pimeloyl-ACP methyl ester carboxylesterase